MFKYFGRWSGSTYMYYCHLTGWEYYTCEFKIEYTDEKFAGCYYMSTEYDWDEWKKNGEMPNQLEHLSSNVAERMIKCVFDNVRN